MCRLLSVLVFVSLAVMGCSTTPHSQGKTSPPITLNIADWPAEPPTVLESALLSHIRAGMTMGKIEAILGKGWIHPLSGVGVMWWKFDDGRKLAAWPRRYHKDEVLGVEGGGRIWIENIRNGKRIKTAVPKESE